MATQETIVDQKHVDLNPVDPNVVVPRHVREAAERADAFYAPQEKTAEEQAADAAAAAAAAEATAAQPQADQPQPDQPQPQPQPQPTENDWQQRFLSMQGRWKASQTQVGQLQEQLVQMGDELSRTTNMLERAGVQPQAPAAGEQPQRGQGHNKLITDQDRETYGDDLIDLTRRAAMEAITPELTQLREDNAALKKNQITNEQKNLRAELTRAVPSWRAIQNDQRWHSFLRLPNVYTGVVRGQMLKAAWDAADASRTVALFQDFIKEVQATGGQLPSTQQQAQPAPVPRVAAMDLENLAAPGRARPAGGDNQVPAEKPTYTRAQIQNFYRDSRRGIYAGREVEKNRLEQDIIAAQMEGRVRG